MEERELEVNYLGVVSLSLLLVLFVLKELQQLIDVASVLEVLLNVGLCNQFIWGTE